MALLRAPGEEYCLVRTRDQLEKVDWLFRFLLRYCLGAVLRDGRFERSRFPVPIREQKELIQVD